MFSCQFMPSKICFVIGFEATFFTNKFMRFYTFFFVPFYIIMGQKKRLNPFKNIFTFLKNFNGKDFKIKNNWN